MSATGKIADFVQRLERLASPQVMTVLSQKMGGEIIRLTDDGIRRGVDPYGVPHKTRTDGKQPLLGFIGTFSAGWSNNWIRVSSSKWYAKVHQAGWKINGVNGNLKFRLPSGQWVSKESVTIPQRRMVPVREEGLGPFWTPPLMQVTERFMRDHLQGRG